MAMSSSLYNAGNDEDRTGLEDLCAFCVSRGKQQPAIHFCYECGPCGRYICGLCLIHHNVFTHNHDVVRISEANMAPGRRTQQQLQSLCESCKRMKDTVEAKTREIKEMETELRKKEEELQLHYKRICEQTINVEVLKQQRDTLLSEKHALETENRDLKRCVKDNIDKKDRKRNELNAQLETVNEQIKKMDIDIQSEQRKIVADYESRLKDPEEKRKKTLEQMSEEYKCTEKIDERRLEEAREIHIKEMWKLKDDMNETKAERDGLKTRVMSKTLTGKKDLVVVASIDLGTTFSRYAFSFMHEFKENPRRICVSTIRTAGTMALIYSKTPTAVLFNSRKEFEYFGCQAEHRYADLTKDGEHESWYFFKRFKMKLHSRKLTRDLEIEDETGKKTMKAMVVFSAAIRYLKDHLLEHLEKRGTQIDSTDIHWVLTVPAIWSDAAKQFMRECACEAGIEAKFLTIALEPEAAALFCQTPLPADSSMSSEVARFTTISPGTKYMVIDLGGETADITVYEKQADKSIKEVHKATGGAWGGTKVNHEFLHMLIKVVGAPVIQKFREEEMRDFLDLERELELTKATFQPSTENWITIRVPVALLELYEEESGEKVTNAIAQSPYRGKIKWRSDKMRIDAEIFKGFFRACRDKLVEHIKDLLMFPAVKGTSIFLMVGGFSESKMMTDAVKSNFPDVSIVVPEDGGMAVVQGAVIFGHSPSEITLRA